MRKITNTEEVNQFYDLVNDHIDEYIIKHKVRPSNLKKYFDSKRIDIFLKKYKLDDVDGIKRVVRDVVEDRLHAEKDKIIKFESFINEGVGEWIGDSDISHERILADLYHISIGHILVTNPKKHQYDIDDMGTRRSAIIYSKEDVLSFKELIIPVMAKSLKSKKVEVSDIEVDETSMITNLNIQLNNIIDEEKLKEYLSEILIEEKVLLIIRSFLGNHNYREEYKGYHIWEFTRGQKSQK